MKGERGFTGDSLIRIKFRVTVVITANIPLLGFLFAIWRGAVIEQHLFSDLIA